MLKMLSGLFARMVPKPDTLALAERAAKREARKRGVDKAVRRLVLRYGDRKVHHRGSERRLLAAGLVLRADPYVTDCRNDLIAQVELVGENGDRTLVYRHTPCVLEYRRRGEWERLLGEAAEEIALNRIGGE